MRSLQEQEHWDYEAGCASELQNAFDWNRMNRTPDDGEKINKAIQEGKYVVVIESTEYCPSTDAAMGTRRSLDSVHAHRELADQAAKAISYCSDFWVYVLPIPKPIHEPTVLSIVFSDIPF